MWATSTADPSLHASPKNQMIPLLCVEGESDSPTFIYRPFTCACLVIHGGFTCLHAPLDDRCYRFSARDTSRAGDTAPRAGGPRMNNQEEKHGAHADVWNDSPCLSVGER